ncbi:MAG: alkyl hydroperoxide reductase subunit F [Pseudomonadota bacterium]
MIDENIEQQLQAYLAHVVLPVELVASLDDSDASREMQALLQTICRLSSRITWRRGSADPRTPSFAIRRAGSGEEVRFAGLPSGHEFSSLVLALLQIGGHPPKAGEGALTQIRALDGELHFESYYSAACQNCPDVVQALNLMSAVNPAVSHTAIDGARFPEEVEARNVMAVPAVFLNGEPFDQGRMSLEQILARLAPDDDAPALEERPPFDVLVVGGGPAASAAAVYAARKGLRTGMAAERMGGQVLDTLGIENFVSTPYTEGPQLAAALESHVAQYDVDLMDGQRVEALVPADGGDGLHRVRVSGGTDLAARAVVVATGARWRALGVPGEAEYRNRGVAYCPHCDGPLFKGKRVAVVGGGNSGVEAAIDLAGLVAHVTLLELDPALRADDVLKRKLASLDNVTVLTSARTMEIHGDGQRVSGLSYEDVAAGTVERLALEGVFVQIGLVPNTEWLDGIVAVNGRGEIEVDEAGRTSIPGVFAAGDVTTTPYKQIVVAMGDGSKAALSAFDHLIRTPEPAAMAADGVPA